jgi:hypothetical protein
MTRRKWSLTLALASALAGAWLFACDLNPQPLPPGEQAPFDSNDAAVPTAGGSGGGIDAGANAEVDGGAGTPPTAIPDGGAQAADGGASDAGAEDAALDAPADAASDGSPSSTVDASDASDDAAGDGG